MKKYLILDGLLTPFTASDANEDEVFTIAEDDEKSLARISEAALEGKILDVKLNEVGTFADVEERMRKAAAKSDYCKRKGILQAPKAEPPEPDDQQKAVAQVAKKHGGVPQAVLAHDDAIAALQKPPVKESDKAALYRAVKTLVEADIRMAGESRPTLTNMTKKVVESGKYNFDQRIEAAEVVIKELLA